MRPNGRRMIDQRMRIFDKIKTKDPKLANQLANLELDWYRIKNSTDGETADLYIYDDIVPNWMVDWFGGVSAESLIEQLNGIAATTINVRINSGGGDVYESIAIYNTLVSHSATINVYVDALAASGASIVAMAGDSITMMVGSQMMIHDALGIEMGNAAEMRAFADFLDKQSDNIASIYANKAGGEVKEWRNLMLAETWMFAQEAVEMGLADGVYTQPKDDDPAESVEEEEKEDEDEEPAEESMPDEKEPEEDEELDNLINRMHAFHSLNNRGYKYSGRKRAPAPIQDHKDTDISDLVDAMLK